MAFVGDLAKTPGTILFFFYANGCKLHAYADDSNLSSAPPSPLSSRPAFPPAYWTSPPGCPTGTSNSTSEMQLIFFFFLPLPKPALSSLSVFQLTVAPSTWCIVQKSRSHPEFVPPALLPNALCF